MTNQPEPKFRYADDAWLELERLSIELESDENGGWPEGYAQAERLQDLANAWILEDEHNIMNVVRVVSEEFDADGQLSHDTVMINVDVDAEAFVSSTYTCACGLIIHWPNSTEIPVETWDAHPGHVTPAQQAQIAPSSAEGDK